MLFDLFVKLYTKVLILLRKLRNWSLLQQIALAQSEKSLVIKCRLLIIIRLDMLENPIVLKPLHYLRLLLLTLILVQVLILIGIKQSTLVIISLKNSSLSAIIWK